MVRVRVNLQRAHNYSYNYISIINSIRIILVSHLRQLDLDSLLHYDRHRLEWLQRA